MITYTDLVISFGIYMPIAIQMYFGADPATLRTQVVIPFERLPAGRSVAMRPLQDFLQAGE